MRHLLETLARRLVFVGGKGGVGKTSVSEGIARAHAARGLRTLWVVIQDPLTPQGRKERIAERLERLNAEASAAFEEYAALKIGVASLTRVFLKNKLMRYLARAAPGIHELVLLGKIWYERDRYDRVVVDMPSTGYGVTLFQSTANFARLFHGGPVHRDAEAMLDSFRDPKACGHLIVSLPEEMPLIESLELRGFLAEMFPRNPAAFLVNRLFPVADPEAEAREGPPSSWKSPLASSALDYARKRSILEAHNLRIWEREGLPYGKLPFLPPAPGRVAERLAAEIAERGYA